jgi:hypothetical protein
VDFSPSRMGNYPESVSESDEEHRLIARYTARLASDAKYPVSFNDSCGFQVKLVTYHR